MNLDIEQLEKNVNEHLLQSNLLNFELHYVIVSDEKTFRLATWNEEPTQGEQKFYCFRADREAGENNPLKESYVLTTDAHFPILKDCKNFASIIDNIQPGTVAKCIRQFTDEDFPDIKQGLDDKYATVQQHLVKSPEAQHQLFVVNNIEISVSATMVYFRQKAPFAESHYQHVKEEA
jgi:hypothetical protein